MKIERRPYLGVCFCLRSTALVADGEWRCSLHIGRPEHGWVVTGVFVEAEKASA